MKSFPVLKETLAVVGIEEDEAFNTL